MKPLALKFRSKSPFLVTSRGGCGHYKENTIQGLEAAFALRPDVVEIDVRKSKDGVLFCHHGSIPFGVPFWHFSPGVSFSWIRKHFPHIPTLAEMIERIPPDTIVIFDIKDARIRADELLSYSRRFTSVCVMGYSIKQLEALSASLPQDYFYILGPIFGFKRKLPRIKGLAGAVALFPWDYRPKVIRAVEAAGILHDPLFALLLPWQLERIKRRFRIFAITELKYIPHAHAPQSGKANAQV